MMNNFCVGVSVLIVYIWIILFGSGDDDVCVMMCKSVDNLGEFYGIVFSVVIFMWFFVFLVWVF